MIPVPRLARGIIPRLTTDHQSTKHMGAMWKSIPHLPPSFFPHSPLTSREPKRPAAAREVFWGVTNCGSPISLSVPKRAPASSYPGRAPAASALSVYKYYSHSTAVPRHELPRPKLGDSMVSNKTQEHILYPIQEKQSPHLIGHQQPSQSNWS